MNRKRSIFRGAFRKDEKGSILVEALLLLPIITIFSIGVLEFGNVLWQRQQLQTGVRDAARYWSRCRPATADFASVCSADIARNIAFYGNPTGTGNTRVPGWDQNSQLTLTPASKSDFPAVPAQTDKVVVTGTVNYNGSPLVSVLNLSLITIEYTHEERYMGW